MVDPHGSGVGAETLGVAHVKGPFAGSFLLSIAVERHFCRRRRSRLECNRL